MILPDVNVGALGNPVAGAYLTAIAVEADCELVTADRDFARFAGSRWRHRLLVVNGRDVRSPHGP